ncbi:hypothetical protein MHBO_004484 [Bonamia ostreae]|uniref:Bromodomain associated domain-containing protein n=1 Tax=Bonamia ostreae TaxID=126728 RepID=A0ABV2ATG0_9EUKA
MSENVGKNIENQEYVKKIGTLNLLSLADSTHGKKAKLSSAALFALENLTEAIIKDIGKTASLHANCAGRNEINFLDCFFSLEKLGVDIESFAEQFKVDNSEKIRNETLINDSDFDRIQNLEFDENTFLRKE